MSENMNRLPRSIQNLISMIGWDATIKLLMARGGTALYIPGTVESARALIVMLDAYVVEALVRRWGNTTLQLPKFDKMMVLQRNQTIISDLNSGQSTSQVAQQYGLTRRMVRYIVKANCTK